MIGGFIVTGTAPKRAALRAVGPSLGSSGLSDVLADPILELRGFNGALLGQNDNWQDDPVQAAQLTALGLALQHPNESGIVTTLAPGPYTAIVAGKNQTSGLGLVEVYDADAAVASRLANISTRGFVQTGNNVMIGGFILGHGNGSANVAVRGIGPSLGQFGLSNLLADPTLELRNSNGALLLANDNWQDDPISAAQLSAYGLAPQNPLESGTFTSLPPGAFTAILAGKNGGVGLGLVELYGDLPANTLTVTNTADSGAGSLRDAIAAANNGDTIQFDAALNGRAIGLTSGELVVNKNITISGPGPTMLAVSRASGTFRIIHITPGHIVRIEGLKISDGFSHESGGGVFNEEATLTLDHCAVEGNYSGGLGGGGIYSSGVSAVLTILNSTVDSNLNNGIDQGGGGQGAGINSDGTLTITDSSVSGNSVYTQPPRPGRSGGIFSAGKAAISRSSVGGNMAGHGGAGITNSGPMVITDSSVSYNTNVLGGFGGGIENLGTLEIRNSTISGNRAIFKQSGLGGGIFNGEILIITNSTITDNSADGQGGGINAASGTLEIGNTILNAGAQGANIYSSPGMVTSRGYNLSSDNAGGFLTGTGDQINTNPMLGPLANNGGPTATHALLTGSPALNAGDPNFTPPPVYDQRGPGFDRVVGGRIDVGSFEVQP